MPLLLRVFVFLSALFACSVVTGSASCNTTELLTALQPLRSDGNYRTCQVDANAASICVSSVCKSLMTPLAALDLPVCQLALKGVVFNTAALRSISSTSCQQQQQQPQQDVSVALMLWTILRLMRRPKRITWTAKDPTQNLIIPLSIHPHPSHPNKIPLLHTKTPSINPIMQQMDILGVDVLPPPGEHDGDDEGGDDHALLRLHVSSSGLQGGSDDATAYDASQPSEEGPSSASSPLSRRAGARRRRKVSKGLQLILLRKYVQCAKQFGRVPDRAATEQLLEQGYDEFYYQGGSLSEPRMSYAAFLKLVRNRRSEVVRQTRGGAPIAQRGGTRRYQKEQIEIQALIDELESVRHGQTRGTLEYDALGAGTTGEHMHAVTTDPSVPTMLSDSSSIMGDAGTDGGVSAGDLSTAETYSSVMAGAPGGGNDDVVVSRSKLDLMLRVAQETLVAQKRILEEVRAMEQRVAGIH